MRTAFTCGILVFALLLPHVWRVFFHSAVCPASVSKASLLVHLSWLLWGRFGANVLVVAQFWWPELLNDVALAREFASTRPAKNGDWEKITGTLSAQFSTEEKPVDLNGRGCRERLERLLDELKSEDSKALKLWVEMLCYRGLPFLESGPPSAGLELRRTTVS